MKVVRRSEAAAEPASGDRFRGPVTRQDLGRIESPDAAALIVTFGEGARTDWHRHESGQVLIVLEGSGRVCTRDGEAVSLTVGDMAYAPPGEEHWHGAADDSSMTQFALSFGETDWHETP